MDLDSEVNAPLDIPAESAHRTTHKTTHPSNLNIIESNKHRNTTQNNIPNQWCKMNDSQNVF